MVQALKLRREEQERDREQVGEFWEDWGLIFTTHVDTPLSPRNDYREFRRIIVTAGLRRARRHDLRHTAASLMLAAGVRLAVLRHVEEVSGNVAATCRYYGIRRQCYYGWLRRYEADGLEGSEDRSQRPHHSPQATQTEVIEKIVWLRKHADARLTLGRMRG